MKKYLNKKRLIILAAILIILPAVFVAAVRLINTPPAPTLLEKSESGTVSLVWEFYACGNDCPYYRVISAQEPHLLRFVGQMADISGVNVWREFENTLDSDEEAAQEIFEAIQSSDKFICTGQFELYTTPTFGECCMDSSNLVFKAEKCDQVAMTEEDKTVALDMAAKENK